MLRQASVVRQVIVFIGAIAVTAVVWLVWLPWHAGKEYFPRQDVYRDAYSTYQIVGLALTMAALAAMSGLLHMKSAVVLAASVSLVAMFSLNASTMPGSMIVNGKWRGGDADLWPISAVLLGAAALLGLGAIAVGVGKVRSLVPRRDDSLQHERL